MQLRNKIGFAPANLLYSSSLTKVPKKKADDDNYDDTVIMIIMIIMMMIIMMINTSFVAQRRVQGRRAPCRGAHGGARGGQGHK
jgi:hypothetical protein